MGRKMDSSVKAAIILGAFILLAVVVGGCFLLTNTILKLSLSANGTTSDQETSGVSCLVAEELLLPYTRGNDGVATQHTYTGRVEIAVSGSGQAAGTAYSDAFYLFTDGEGFYVPPEELNDWLLTVNSDPARYAIIDRRTPPYNDEHTYTFEINAPGGVLHFGIMDGHAGDNSGSLSISLCQK